MNVYVAALLPSVGILILFIVVMRAVIFADRRERAAQQRIDEEIARARALDDDRQ
ncbi:MAG: hypothetical protein ACK5KU_04745 [Beutenbergiaceae bacterium]